MVHLESDPPSQFPTDCHTAYGLSSAHYSLVRRLTLTALTSHPRSTQPRNGCLRTSHCICTMHSYLSQANFTESMTWSTYGVFSALFRMMIPQY